MSLPLKKLLLKEANNNTVAILIKLFATRMVANNFFGRSISFEMISNFLEPSSRPLSRSDRVNEKRATSAPEIRPEHNNKTSSRIMPRTRETLSEENKMTKLVGSGSNRHGIG